MILRFSEAISRALLVLVASLIAIFLSYYAIRMAVAAHFSKSSDATGLERAVRLEPKNPEYWYTLGRYRQFNLEESDTSKAIEAYQHAISLSPLHTSAWLDLATAYELDGQAEQARHAHEMALKSHPASAEVSWRFGNFLLRLGDMDAAMSHLRTALQADPARAAAAYSRVYRAYPNMDAILDKLLPPIPSVYVDVIGEAAHAQEVDLALQVWNRLLALHPSLQRRDIEPLVSALYARGDYAQARRVLEQGTPYLHLPERVQPSGSVLWDGGFESGVVDYLYAWKYQRLTNGVQSELDPDVKLSGERALRISFDGRGNPNMPIACTLTPVDPDTSYQFSAWIKTKDLTTEEGVRFNLHPQGQGASAALESREFHGTNPWTRLDLQWSAGPQDRLLEICLRRNPSDNPDVRISGSAWIDDVALIPQPAEPR